MRGVTAGLNPDGTSQPIEYVDITTATPEPASFLLAIPALPGLWFMHRKKAGSILCVATLGLFAGSIHAATITSEAQCSAGGNNDIGTTSCSASGFDTVQGRQIATEAIAAFPIRCPATSSNGINVLAPVTLPLQLLKLTLPCRLSCRPTDPCALVS